MSKKRFNNASLYINNSELRYKIRYSGKAKYLRLQINPLTGLEVVIPRGCKPKEAEEFIYKKKDWILKHLKNIYVEEELSYFGKKIEINQKYNLFLTRHKISFCQNILLIESPPGSSEDIKLIFSVWLKRCAKSYLTERTGILARKYNFATGRVKIRNQKTRWGSCSSSGNISLNYRLMKYRKELIDYVIIHELCHLKKMNHSKRFWKHVEDIIPNYRALKHELKAHL